MSADPTIADVITELRSLRDEVHALRLVVPEVLVDATEAARVLDISPRTLRRWVDLGQIPFRRVGRSLRFPLASLKPKAA